MSKCICGWEIDDPPYEHWEECPNCERKLAELEYERKQGKYVTQLEERVAKLQEALETIYKQRFYFHALNQCWWCGGIDGHQLTTASKVCPFQILE